MPINKVTERKEQELEGTPAPPPEPKPTEWELKRHGKTVKLPEDKVLDLAQMGFDYTEKSTALKAERERFKADATRYGEYETLRNHLDANPDVAKAVAKALEDPQSVLSPQAPPREDYTFEQGGDQTPPRDKEAHSEIQALKAQVSALMKADSQRNVSESRTAANVLISSEIASYPWLIGKAKETAMARIVSEMERDSTQSPSAVTAIVATEIRELLEEDQQRRLDESKPKERFRPEPPGRGIPLPKPPEKLDKHSLQNGKMLAAVKDAARSFGLPVD